MNDVYLAFAEAFDFPKDVGNNLDALYDRLSTDVKGPVEIRWEGHQCARRALGEEQFDMLMGLMEDVQVARGDLTIILV